VLTHIEKEEGIGGERGSGATDSEGNNVCRRQEEG